MIAPDYHRFIDSKRDISRAAGFDPVNLCPALFPWQSRVVEWACRQGRSALFADTGLGKTIMQCAWAQQVARLHGPVIIVAPLAVGSQTVREAAKFGIDGLVFTQEPIDAEIVVTNYESIHKFDVSRFAGVVLDESSILKSYTGRVRTRLIEMFSDTPYRLACTATPSPNDHTELGNHAEFLGIMKRTGMLSRWFVNDASHANTWRLKGHGRQHFWSWVCSWARCIGKPSDVGRYSDDGYVLPGLVKSHHLVDVDLIDGRGAGLFRSIEGSATSIHKEKRRTAPDRALTVAGLVAMEPDEPWLVWVETDYDAQAVLKALDAAGCPGVEVKGSHSLAIKVKRLDAFAAGDIRVLVTKPKIAGFGLNWQHCRRMVFAGPGYSYEALYQAIRRCWRFGQTRSVHAHIVLATTEQGIWANLSRKSNDHEAMKGSMFEASRWAAANRAAVITYYPTHNAAIPRWLETR